MARRAGGSLYSGAILHCSLSSAVGLLFEPASTEHIQYASKVVELTHCLAPSSRPVPRTNATRPLPLGASSACQFLFNLQRASWLPVLWLRREIIVTKCTPSLGTRIGLPWLSKVALAVAVFHMLSSESSKIFETLFESCRHWVTRICSRSSPGLTMPLWMPP